MGFINNDQILFIHCFKDLAKQDGIKAVDTIGFLPIAIHTNEALKLYDSGYEEELSQLAGLWFVKPESTGIPLKEELQQIDKDRFNRGDTVLMNLEPGGFSGESRFKKLSFDGSSGQVCECFNTGDRRSDWRYCCNPSLGREESKTALPRGRNASGDAAGRRLFCRNGG